MLPIAIKVFCSIILGKIRVALDGVLRRNRVQKMGITWGEARVKAKDRLE